jgi:hypothetical protein
MWGSLRAYELEKRAPPSVRRGQIVGRAPGRIRQCVPSWPLPVRDARRGDRHFVVSPGWRPRQRVRSRRARRFRNRRPPMGAWPERSGTGEARGLERRRFRSPPSNRRSRPRGDAARSRSRRNPSCPSRVRASPPAARTRAGVARSPAPKPSDARWAPGPKGSGANWEKCALPIPFAAVRSSVARRDGNFGPDARPRAIGAFNLLLRCCPRGRFSGARFFQKFNFNAN